MSGDGQTQLHDAVLAALRAAVKPVPVHDHVPQGDPNKRPFPYLVIGENEVGEFDTDTEVGQEHRVMVHVFSRQRGKQETRDLLKKIYDALHAQPLSLAAGAALVHIHWELSDISPDPDGLTYHGVSRFRALTTET